MAGLSLKNSSTPAETSIPWFVEFMGLHSRGVTPTCTAVEYMPSEEALEEFWGSRTPAGYVFNDHGIPAYAMYVRQLFARVHQLPWPLSGVLTFDFAKGLLVEALGVEVNWADYAYRRTHPPQWRITIPRVLPEYRSLVAPLPPLRLVMPRANITNEYLMATSIAQFLNMQGGTTNEADTALPELRSTPDAIQCPGRTYRAFPCPPARGIVLNAEDTSLVPATAAQVEQGSGSSLSSYQDSQTLGTSAISGFMLLRPNLIGAIQHERIRVTNALDDIAKSCSNIRLRLSEEHEKLKSLERKVVEKSGSHDRAAFALQRARDMVNSAKMENACAAPKDRKIANKEFLKTSEQIEEYWGQSVADAGTRLQRWEFKQQRQQDRILSLTAELNAAEALLKEKRASLDNTIESLQAAADALDNMWEAYNAHA